MCAPTCKAVCGCMEGCTKGCCDTLQEVFCGEKPFPLFSSFTFCAQFVPGVAFAVLGGLALGDDCGTLPIFLIITGVMGVLNFIMAAYFYWRITMDSEDKELEGSGFEKAKHVLCYDPLICLFGFFVVPFHLVWSILGIVWLSDAGGDCSALVPSIIAIVLYFVFLGMGFFVSCCSLCCNGLKENGCCGCCKSK